MADTVREKALKALVAHIGTMTEGEPLDDPYTVSWGIITRADLNDRPRGKKYALGVYDTEETKTSRIQVSECTLRVILEFHAYKEKSEDPSTLLNRVLGDLDRKLREDRQLGKAVRDTEITGNELSIDGMFDNYVSGVLYLNLKYRHKVDDPRSSV